MAKVILICGKICCGKSTYAKELCKGGRGVQLSVDALMLALFGQHAGAMHDEYVRRIKTHLLDLSVQIIHSGSDVILDWGFWTKDERAAVKQFFADRQIPCEMHYLDISDAVWQARIAHRNQLVAEGRSDDYYVDEALAQKFAGLFQTPAQDEIDVSPLD